MTRPPLLTLVLRTAFLVGAGLALILALRISGTSRMTAGVYACPMHPSALARGPGACPICGMELVAIRVSMPRPAALPSTERVQRRTLFRASRAPAWVEDDGRVVALPATEDVADLAAGEATFHPASRPDAAVSVRALSSSADGGGRLPFAVRQRGRVPSMGTVGWIERPEAPRSELLVPAVAVLADPDGTSVLVLAPDGTLARRSFRAGRTVLGFTTVLGGLSEGERVVGGDAFFVDLALRWTRAGPGAGQGR